MGFWHVYMGLYGGGDSSVATVVRYTAVVLRATAPTAEVTRATAPTAVVRVKDS